MAKREAIDLALSDSDFDGDFVHAKKAIHPFLYQAPVYYIKFLYIKLQRDSCMYVVMDCSLVT